MTDNHENILSRFFSKITLIFPFDQLEKKLHWVVDSVKAYLAHFKSHTVVMAKLTNTESVKKSLKFLSFLIQFPSIPSLEI